MTSAQFEHQAKYKIHDRWALREKGVSETVGFTGVGIKRESEVQVKQEERAARLEHKMISARGPRKPRIKVEKFDDDLRREGRQLERVNLLMSWRS